MIQLESSRETVDVVNDQRGQPTWSAELAHQVVRLVDSAAPAGVYPLHRIGPDDMARISARRLRRTRCDPDRIHPTTTDRFPRPAPRPACQF